jgi:hypothetical protein
MVLLCQLRGGWGRTKQDCYAAVAVCQGQCTTAYANNCICRDRGAKGAEVLGAA